ncbi:MAG: class I SAM-dependent methyltransferase [Desulfocapsaceae bacterium]|nr:class I SAM-dependent methyltransferase [Desulfocapsaceae bacterium]
MPHRHPQTYADIDWNRLWQNARRQKSWTDKTAADWDKKAQAFADRNADSPYAALVLSRLPLDPSMTILDIGAGPGTLTLPLASRVATVTALDYSPQMLAILQKQAQASDLANVRTITCAWEDDWAANAVGIHDLAIASRSLGVEDLDGALKKLNDHAKRFVFITDRIAPTPFDPAAFRAIGRPFDSGPDYIYTLNALYRLNIHPCVEILQLERDLVFADMDEALASFAWMFSNLTAGEYQNLRRYLTTRIIRSEGDRVVIRREFPPRWAMIWWKKMAEEEYM